MERENLPPEADGSSQDLWNQLAGYAAGDGSPEERAVLDQWLHADPERIEALAQVQRAWHAKAGFRRPANIDGAWAKLSDRIARTPTPSRLSTPQGRGDASRWGAWKPRFGSWRTTLPGIGIALGALIFIANIATHQRVTSDAHVSGRDAGEKIYVTQVGQRATLALSDGSRVTLAPQTTLRLASGFGKTTRAISLTGEAYFEVANAAATPFVIRTGGVSTRVLGTAFNIRRYPNDATVRVAVSAGKVSVEGLQSHRSFVTLTAGMVGDVTDSTATAVASDDIEQYTTWTKGNLVFRKAPTTEVLAALTRWYGYRFQLADSSLAHKNITVWLSTGSLSTALATLKLALDADLTFNDSVVTLRAHRATRGPLPSRRDSQDPLSTLKPEFGR